MKNNTNPMKTLLCLITLVLSLPAHLRADEVFKNGDQFEMRLSGPPEEFTREFNLMLRVSDGTVNLPMVGRIAAVNLTSNQLAQVIENRLKLDKIFTIANVNISLNATQNPRTFIIGGAVRQSGRQPWSEDLTLMAAISAAGGTSEWVKDRIKITRGGRPLPPYSLKAIKKGTMPDPKVMAGDVIDIEGDL